MKRMEPLNHAAFAEYLDISERSLRRYRDRLKSDFGCETTFEGSKNQTLYHPDWFETYAQLRDGAPLCCEVNCPEIRTEDDLPSSDTEIVVHKGNHCEVVDLAIPRGFDLGELRSGSAVTTVGDPLALAEQALAAMDAVSNAMKLDLQDQKAKLRATQTAADQISARATELRLEKLQYQIETRVTAELQNPATAKLQKGLGVLGKVPSPDGSNDSAGSSQ